MSDNERGFHHPHKVDKGIMRGAHDLNSVPCSEMPSPLRGDAPISDRPHDAGPRAPVHIAPSGARPANDMGPPVHPGGVLNPDPHPYNPSSSVKLPNTYGTVRR
jgi:hypothetical protein